MEKLKYRIGLDVGIASVGWAVLGNDIHGNPEQIIARGVRTFEACENPKDGKALTAERREFRSVRRRLRRKQHRLFRIKHLLAKECKVEYEKILEIFNLNTATRRDIYTIRYLALDEKIECEEWIRLLVHLAQKRGFKSNRKNEKSGDAGKLKKAVESNEHEIAELSCRTVGEFIYKKYIANNNMSVKNKFGDYKNTFSRAQLDMEVDMLFDCQRNFGNPTASKTFQEKYKTILMSQRSFDQGPGGTSRYSGGIEQMLGVCTFENTKNGMQKNEQRAPKNSYTFEKFMVLQKVNNLRMVIDGKIKELSAEQRNKLVKLAFEKNKVTYKDIRKVLALAEDTKFAFYIKDENLTFIDAKGYHELRKCLDTIEKGYITKLSVDEINKIAYCLTVNKNDETISKELMNQGFDEKIITALTSESAPSFTKVSHLSLKAINNIIPYLESGMSYDKACESAGYDFRNLNKNGMRSARLSFNDISEEIISPVVKRSISQAIKIINAIVREYGIPETVCIELTREMAKTFDERNKIRRDNEKNQEKNETAIARIKELGQISPSGEDIVKYKLWQDQHNMCAYSGHKIPAERLFEPNFVEVDHIIPWSKSFDNSYKNKVLVLTHCNQEKGNRLPLEYIATKGEVELNRFKLWVEQFVSSHAKKSKLLCTEIDEEGFQQKNLQDTQYATRKLADFLRKNLLFTDNDKIKEKVICVNGNVTAYLRKRWGIEKSRDTDDHHAKDAICVACCNQKLINTISRHEIIRRSHVHDSKTNKWVSTETGELLDDIKSAKHFPLPWDTFRDDLIKWFSNTQQDETIKPLFVSKMSNHKITGAAHAATIKRTFVDAKQEFFVNKVPLNKLKLTKDGCDIERYYNKESDRLLYDKLLEQLQAFGGDAVKAFPVDMEFRKPCKFGDGNFVKSVKIVETTSSNVKLLKVGAAAANGAMVRIDVFSKTQKDTKQFYFVPIYVADFKKKELPNAATPGNEIMDENQGYIFMFSLYTKDLVRIKRKTDDVPRFLYYVKSDRSTGSISLTEHNNSNSNNYINGLGIKTLEIFEKWEVDVLGNYRQSAKVPRETKTLYKGRKK